MRIRATALAAAACAAMAMSTAAAVPALASQSSGGGSTLTGYGWSQFSCAYAYRVTSHTDHTVIAAIYGTNYSQDLPGIALGQVTIPPRATVMIPMGTHPVRVQVCYPDDARTRQQQYCPWVTEQEPNFLPYNWLTLKGSAQSGGDHLVIHVIA